MVSGEYVRSSVCTYSTLMDVFLKLVVVSRIKYLMAAVRLAPHGCKDSVCTWPALACLAHNKKPEAIWRRGFPQKRRHFDI